MLAVFAPWQTILPGCTALIARHSTSNLAICFSVPVGSSSSAVAMWVKQPVNSMPLRLSMSRVSAFFLGAHADAVHARIQLEMHLRRFGRVSSACASARILLSSKTTCVKLYCTTASAALSQCRRARESARRCPVPQLDTLLPEWRRPMFAPASSAAFCDGRRSVAVCVRPTTAKTSRRPQYGFFITPTLWRIAARSISQTLCLCIFFPAFFLIVHYTANGPKRKDMPSFPSFPHSYDRSIEGRALWTSFCCALALLGGVIGAGFASGGEIVRFFAAHGAMGFIAVAFCACRAAGAIRASAHPSGRRRADRPFRLGRGRASGGARRRVCGALFFFCLSAVTGGRCCGLRGASRARLAGSARLCPRLQPSRRCSPLLLRVWETRGLAVVGGALCGLLPFCSSGCCFFRRRSLLSAGRAAGRRSPRGAGRHVSRRAERRHDGGRAAHAADPVRAGAGVRRARRPALPAAC